MTTANEQGSMIKFLILAVLAVFVLGTTGCSSKHSVSPRQGYTQSHSQSQSSTDGAAWLPKESAGEPLSSTERAILERSTGGICDMVPASGKRAVEQQYKYFLRNGRKTMKIYAKRSEKYFAYARQVFRKHGLPEELACLALVESGYNPRARSHAGAAGAWQFVKFTGMKYGLNQDEWLDERLDIYRETEAAASYLKALYGQFRDWPTAIAAYNAGEGKISRACAAAGVKTFWALCENNNRLDAKTRLKEETLQYVPRFMAMTRIMGGLTQLGFDACRPIPADSIARIEVKPNTDLRAMASACGVSWTQFAEDNPHHLKGISNPVYTTNVYVPSRYRATAVAFAKNPVFATRQMAQSARSLPAASSARSSQAARSQGDGQVHILASGETLYGVARKYGTSAENLMVLNGITNPSQLYQGQRILVSAKAPARATPVASAAKPVSAKAPVASRSTASSRYASSGVSATGSYRVQANDNLWRISRKLNCSVDDLVRWNNLSSQNVHIGQTLVVCK